MQIIAIGDEVHLTQVDETSTLEELPKHKHNNHDRNLDVIGDEIDAAKFRAETRPALDQDEHGVEADRQDGTDRVCPVLERKQVFESLGFDTGAEAQRRETDADPGQLVRDADNVLQPRPQLSGTDVTSAKTQTADGRGGQDGHPGDLEAVEMAEESGRVTVDGERVQESRSGEQGVVGGRDDAGQDDGVDEAARDVAASFGENDGEGAGAGVLLAQVGIVVRHVEADQQDGQDVEEQDAPEDVAHDPRQVLGRVFGLSGGHGDGFGSSVRERRGHEDRGESSDAAHKRRVANVPIVAADVFVVAVAAAVDHDAQDDEDDDRDDFEQAEPVFDLVIDPVS